MRIVIFLLIIVSGLLSTSAQTEPLRANDTTSVTQLTEVVVVANPVSKVRNSAFNATAINTSDLLNTTRTLSETLNSAPGMKIRESGGVGSDMAVTMVPLNGYSTALTTCTLSLTIKVMPAPLAVTPSAAMVKCMPATLSTR